MVYKCARKFIEKKMCQVFYMRFFQFVKLCVYSANVSKAVTKWCLFRWLGYGSFDIICLYAKHRIYGARFLF